MVDAQEIANNGISENARGQGASFSLFISQLFTTPELLITGIMYFLLLFLMLKQNICGWWNKASFKLCSLYFLY